MPGFVPLVSVVELVWVLSSCQPDRAQITQALDVLLRARQLRVDQAELVARALRAYGAGTADFADA